MPYRFGPDHPDATYVPHGYPEQLVDLGEIAMNYAVAGSDSAPALLLIPGQTESCRGYEQAMKLLEKDFRAYAVDLRGQGRSGRTPGRYTLDNWGNDLVRFIQLVIGDWKGMVAAAQSVLPKEVLAMAGFGDEPSQNLKEYDPEWARAFWTGSATVGCDHDRMLKNVKVPVLFTHHFRRIDEISGTLQGAISDPQINRVRTHIEGAGQKFSYRSFPQMGHPMHRIDPALYVATLKEWGRGLQ